ncbi:hypothetical protein MFUR16E_24440 [Methylobacterium fujisawaense]|nr:hypothetical protein [Methylobacterium sp. OT2]
MAATRRPSVPRSRVRKSRTVPGAGWGRAMLAALLGGMLAAPFAHGQGADDLEAEMRARVAAAFPDAGLVRFRKIRPIPAEAESAVAFCGQVSSGPVGQGRSDFQVFLYDRTASAETVRILGSESLNGYRVGRKLIGALRRVGCL